ncbi:hypothetical protein K443DRAFT_122789 [Laccaria amethystina LaAM-08-1]|uniref:Uncharacterized protein n=1 Tax=Laccaria amethystina LaAM-08-1 TaxID=1095629 RepID=A0A0C9WQF8_9AGAR|nr:hypothetical protein K443DRAFT_122789 [Laccaria amethystina LaAM-08-1]
MAFILRPLEKLGVMGLHLQSRDGAIHDCHPIFAAHIEDYPEQVLVTAIKTGECPICPAKGDELEDPDCVREHRDLTEILDALNSIDKGATEFTHACKAAGINPIQQPFWKNLPFVHIYHCITPNILHQLYQGVIKHVISWVCSACGDAGIDARCRRLPPISDYSSRASHTCLELLVLSMTKFVDSSLAFLSTFSSQMACGTCLICAVRGILDFLYLAKYPVHTTETLDELDAVLQEFDDNKKIFINLCIHNDFNFPKGHFTHHYRYLIQLYETADIFNTEYTERLHIDLAKDAYHSTNSKDEYPQMTLWLDCHERILLHDKYLRWRLSTVALDNSGDQPLLPPPPLLPKCPLLVFPCEVKMSQRHTEYGVSLDTIKESYRASCFNTVLARYIIHLKHPEFPQRQVTNAAEDFHIPFHKVSVFHRIKFISHDPFSTNPSADIVVDSIHSEPPGLDKYGKVIPA